MTEYMEKRRNENIKKVWMTVCGILTAAAVTFAIMWFVAKNDQSSEAREAAAAAARAAEAFADYAENETGSGYIRALSEYYAFCLNIRILTNDTNRASYYTDASAMYEVLIGQDSYGRAHSAELSAIMKRLSKDIYEPDAYRQLKQLAEGKAE